MLFQIYGTTAVSQLLGWCAVFVGLILANEIARRTKAGGIALLVALPLALTAYFVAVAVAASWCLNTNGENSENLTLSRHGLS